MNFDPEQKKSDYGIPGSDPRKTTQGLWYSSFGMDETSRGQRKQRFFLGPPASWHLRFVSRATRFFPNRKDAADPKKAVLGKSITAEQALGQATAALWLLCCFGAIGSKGRKGFGSLAMKALDGWKLENCGETAGELRAALQLPNTFDERRAQSPSLQQMLGPVEVDFGWPSVWSVLDQAGFAYQAFAKRYRHHREKKALGLPRRIGPPASGRFDPTGPVEALLEQARRERKEDNVRHASPVHIHVSKLPGGQLRVCAAAFPAAYLPDLPASRIFSGGVSQGLWRRFAPACRLAAAFYPFGPRRGPHSRAAATCPRGAKRQGESQIPRCSRGPEKRFLGASNRQETRAAEVRQSAGAAARRGCGNRSLPDQRQPQLAGIPVGPATALRSHWRSRRPTTARKEVNHDSRTIVLSLIEPRTRLLSSRRFDRTKENDEDPSLPTLRSARSQLAIGPSLRARSTCVGRIRHR